ncbi:MAG: hypothetical protein Q9M43_05730, partial [Sulfurimonas sp.]|nr:hypothetical protein [Sulfurimonas sp.]
KLRESGAKNSSHVYESENTKIALIDLNYNFFVEVLGDWIEHYAKNKRNTVEYIKYRYVKNDAPYDVIDIAKKI